MVLIGLAIKFNIWTGNADYQEHLYSFAVVLFCLVLWSACFFHVDMSI